MRITNEIDVVLVVNFQEATVCLMEKAVGSMENVFVFCQDQTLGRPKVRRPTVG